MRRVAYGILQGTAISGDCRRARILRNPYEAAPQAGIVAGRRIGIGVYNTLYPGRSGALHASVPPVILRSCVARIPAALWVLVPASDGHGAYSSEFELSTQEGQLEQGFAGLNKVLAKGDRLWFGLLQRPLYGAALVLPGCIHAPCRHVIPALGRPSLSGPGFARHVRNSQSDETVHQQCRMYLFADRASGPVSDHYAAQLPFQNGRRTLGAHTGM